MPFKNENIALGLRKEDQFKVGLSDFDNGELVEENVLLPWASNPASSWLYYDCTVGVMLDSGIVVHNRLPQINITPDSLSSCLLDDPNLDRLTGIGVNLSSRDQYEDIVQRMGHSRYWFRLWGQALRAGEQIPIPGIQSIGGVTAIPYDKNPQSAFNRIFQGGNYGGVVLWHAAWSLWYTTATPPQNNFIPTGDAAAHISEEGQIRTLNGFEVPISQPDDESINTATLVTKKLPTK